MPDKRSGAPWAVATCFSVVLGLGACSSSDAGKGSGGNGTGGAATGGTSAGGQAGQGGKGGAGGTGFGGMSTVGTGGNAGAGPGGSSGGGNGGLGAGGANAGGHGGKGQGGTAGMVGVGGAGASAGSGGSGGSGSTFGPVQAIFDARCVRCHDPAHPLVPETQTYVEMPLVKGMAYAALVNIAAHEICGGTRVVPGQPEQSYLYRKVVDASPCDGERMPHRGMLGTVPPLPDAEIATLRDWIAGGARP